MTLTLKQAGIAFKRYDIDHPSGPNFRAITVTDKNLKGIYRYLEGRDEVEVEYDPTKNRLYIKQWRTYRNTTGKHIGHRRRKNAWLVVREGDHLVQYHDASWERLTHVEFEAVLVQAKPVDFRIYSYLNADIKAVQVTQENGLDIVRHIKANFGRATVSERVLGDIRIMQRVRGKNWTKRDWRVARPGDYVVEETNGEYFRVVKHVFEADAILNN